MMRTLYIIILLLPITCMSQDDQQDVKQYADVVSVKTSGTESNYTFSVEVSSPDLGCQQYADWWEVLTEDGRLLYRRILAHSHVNEQPFVRSGGKVKIGKDELVIVRVHMSNTGYGRDGQKGSVFSGFKKILLEEDFAKNLEKADPQPSGCAF